MGEQPGRDQPEPTAESSSSPFLYPGRIKSGLSVPTVSRKQERRPLHQLCSFAGVRLGGLAVGGGVSSGTLEGYGERRTRRQREAYQDLEPLLCIKEKG